MGITVMNEEFDWNSIDGLILKLEILKAQHGNVRTFVKVNLDNGDVVTGYVDAEFDESENGIVIY